MPPFFESRVLAAFGHRFSQYCTRKFEFRFGMPTEQCYLVATHISVELLPAN